MELRREKVDDSLSERILLGMIVSDKVIQELSPILVKEYFSVAPLQLLSDWIIDYYRKYKKSPKKDIVEIFQYESRRHSFEINEYLEGLFSRMDLETDTRNNEELLISQAIQYFKGKAIELTVLRARGLLEKGKLADAEEALTGFKRVSKNLGDWINPFDQDYIHEVFQSDERGDHQLFRFPGALGDLLGFFERGTLVGVLAPMKRGKSWWLLEIAVQSMIEKFRVLFISLEMNAHNVSKRIYKRLTAFHEAENADILYPIFDCRKNQFGSCTSPLRVNRVTLINPGKDHPPVFSRNNPYRVCTVCRGKEDFELTTWFTIRKREKLSLGKSRQRLRAIETQYAPKFRLKKYPAYSANIRDILRDIQILEDVEGFIPDVICLDYADILAPEDTRVTGRERLDETWKMLKNLGDVRQCAVFTASQTNRKAIDKITVTQTDIAEDIRKIAHVDTMLSLNQLPEEKRLGIMRIGMIAAREDSFDEYQHCMVLQQLTVGQPRLDSEIIREPLESGE